MTETDVGNRSSVAWFVLRGCWVLLQNTEKLWQSGTQWAIEADHRRPQFLGLSHRFRTILDYKQWASVPIWAHPSSICGAEVRVLLANSADPAAVDSRGRALLLRCFFLLGLWDSVLSHQWQSAAMGNRL